MMIEARIPLTLPKVKTKIVVSYNTYKLATYDQYLAASIVVHAQSDNDVYQFIDDITGKGSLNNHFHKLVDDIRKLDNSTIRKVLDNSNYPVTLIDESNQYTYYPVFDVSEYKGEILKGDIKSMDSDELKKLLNIQDDIIKVEIKSKEDIRSDTYSVRFKDNLIEICLNKHDWQPLSSHQFNNIFSSDIKDVDRYSGAVLSDVDGKGWVLLKNDILERLCKNQFSFYDNDGNHVSISGSLEVTQILNVHGMFLYRLKHIDYSKQNGNICQQALEHLLENDLLFDFPTDRLVKLTHSVKEHWQQKVCNYILSRRDDNKIAEIGCNLIASITDGWEKESLLSIKKVYRKGLTTLYKISADLDYTDAELSKIDFKVLTEEHQERMRAYMASRQNKLDEIRSIIGEITNSGIRERMKSLEVNELTKVFKKELNKYVAHQKNDIGKYDDEHLDDYISKIEEMYLHFLDVQKMLDEKPKI